MPRRKQAEDLTVERLRDLLHYNPRSGALTWRKDRGSNAKAGDEAGSVNKHRVVMIGIDGRSYTAARIAWALAKGQMPSKRIRFLNGDSQDLRFENMVPEGESTRSLSKAARYQRRRRKERKEVDAYIASRPSLRAKYESADASTAREIYLDIVHYLRDGRVKAFGVYAVEEELEN